MARASMIGPVLIQLVATFGVLSLLSIGGAAAILPEVHRQIVVELHWMSDATFASLVALGQTAPGPNVLIISTIGWQVAGWLGMLIATVAMVAPSTLLTIAVGRLMTRFNASGSVRIARQCLAPVGVGLMLASGFVMTEAAYRGALTIVVVAAMTALVVQTRLSPLWGIAGGGLAGVLAHHVGALP
jgi:chromate transporter